MLNIILGMHKSGTSLLAELLHRSGIRMGEGREVEGSYDEGTFFERAGFRELNQEILGFADPVELHPAPLRLAASPEQRERMRKLAERFVDGAGEWGFKDPRTCLTYPLWRDELPLHRVVGIYRALPEVWGHYARRTAPPPARRTVRSWCEYNAGLVAALETATVPWILIRYESLMEGPDELARLGRFLGRAVPDARRGEQRRSRPTGGARLAVLGFARSCAGLPAPARVARDLERLRARSLAAG